MDRPVIYLKFPLLISLIGILLISCGGGGGGGFDYAGNSRQATISSTNASTLTAIALGYSKTTDVSSRSRAITRSSSLDTNQLHLAYRLRDQLSDTLIMTLAGRSTESRTAERTEVDETNQCENGSVHVNGTINDNGTGELTFDYSNCRFGDETLNGKARLNVFAFDQSRAKITDSTFTYLTLTRTTPTLDESISGSLRFRVNVSTDTDQSTFNIVTRHNNSGRMVMSENLVLFNTYLHAFPRDYTQIITGRVFDSAHGYVDITTPEILAYGGSDQEFPSSGQLMITGVNDTSIRVIAASDNSVRLELNFDSDSDYELSATLQWIQLGTQAGSDLADTDGDGMNNSWEIANGFDPNDPVDANHDADNDGVNNLNEYLGSSDPGNSSSLPLTADISITNTFSVIQRPVLAIGENLTYKISVKNNGPDTANNVIVKDILPANVTLVSATTLNVGSCSQTSVISCELGTMRRGLTLNIDIVVTMTSVIPVTVDNTATVKSSVYDSNTVNNSSTASILAGVQPTSVLQSMIDAALPGDIVQVNPGTYIGGLDFNGKDITLKASGGATDTVIHGNNSLAVKIGPEGSIQGFTITGGRASFGGAIEVDGTGTLISDNIFVGNEQTFRGYGVAIYGNTASPIIERNIFRDNFCGTHADSSLVSFVNSSSPVISNNIFEGNLCRSIDMSLPSGNTPTIINNSFIGNRVGIYFSRQVNSNTQIYRNNIIVNNEIGLEAGSGTDLENPIWENNLVFNNTSNNYEGVSDQSGVNGNFSSDPIFVDLAAGNYQLQIGSPAIDSGSSLDAPTIDIEGTTRPLNGNGMAGAQIDIGAFEAPAL